MMRASIVVGANYGDEGKGLTTDWLACAARNPLVVRYNGGAQAGHTVVTPDGNRHVFHHFGSGALAGAPTCLSLFFAVHPMFFRKELAMLKSLGANTKLYVDRSAPVTTPYDVMLNQAAEKMRGEGRHGSCGLGFNETLHRTWEGDPSCGLFYNQLGSERHLRIILEKIRREYVPERAKQLGITEEIEYLMDDRVLDRFIEDCKFMWVNAEWWEWSEMIWPGDLIFEGAQGLRLDEKHQNFPHVTRSRTGIENAMDLIRESPRGAGIVPDVYYVTRAYLTRHGAGPLPNELPRAPYAEIKDETNVPNQHQGALRFAWIDIDEMVREINADKKGYKVNPIAVVTCADQTGGRVRFIDKDFDAEMDLSAGEFAATLSTLIDGEKCVVSSGPTRETMMEYDNARFDDQRIANKPSVDDQVQPGLQVLTSNP